MGILPDSPAAWALAAVMFALYSIGLLCVKRVVAKERQQQAARDRALARDEEIRSGALFFGGWEFDRDASPWPFPGRWEETDGVEAVYFSEAQKRVYIRCNGKNYFV